jgi:hypothetical protein
MTNRRKLKIKHKRTRKTQNRVARMKEDQQTFEDDVAAQGTTYRYRIRGGDCGCGTSSLQHMMSHSDAATKDPNLILRGGNGWNGGPNPFYQPSALYPSYPLNTHQSDPNNPSAIAQTNVVRGGGRSRRRRRSHRRIRKSMRDMRGGGASWFNDLFFGNSSNPVYQVGTTPGAELQRSILLGKSTESSTFSQMGPSNHNRLYV